MKRFSLIIISILIFNFITAEAQIHKEIGRSSVASGGILVSVNELHTIKKLAESGNEPCKTDVALFIGYIDSLMRVSINWPQLRGEISIADGSSSEPVQISSTGAKLVYGAAIAWHLTDNEKYAGYARKLILDITDTYGYRDANRTEFHFGAQGILNLARGCTPYIYAASLLDGWQGWSASDKLTFQVWLRDVMYLKVAWASRTRKNNWGVAASYAAALIAYYLIDHPEWKMEEISPFPKKLTPREAFESHNAYQLGRLKTTTEWKMDAKTVQWGILPNGAIPEEIRRGKDRIDADHLTPNEKGTEYTMTHIEHLTAHAEFLHRQGDNSLYDNVETDGSGSLLQAYLFVIDNPNKSICFTPDHMNALYMACRYYENPALLRSLTECSPGSISGHRLALFGRLTHSLKSQ